MKKIIFIFILLGSLLIAYTSSAHWFALLRDNELATNIKEHSYPTPNSYGDSARYFPMKIGNKFYYKYKITQHWNWIQPDSTLYDSGYYVSKVMDTVRKDSKQYYKINSFLLDTAVGYFRYDIDSGFLMVHDPWNWCSNENKYHKLISVLNEYGHGSCLYYNIAQKCVALKDTTVFGLQKKLKRFYISWGGTSTWRFETFYVKDIGITQYIDYRGSLSSGYSITTIYNLTGAYINGVKYGDTNTIGIRQISGTVPDKYELYQNYPNPFNPTTIIKYSIPRLSSPHAQELSSPHAQELSSPRAQELSSPRAQELSSPRALGGDLVLLKVYDILGKEIATLVNEKQFPGTYELTFDGSKFASGIYFYSLIIDGKILDTKKLILLK